MTVGLFVPQVPPGMQAVALDMLEVMVRSSTPPLGEPLINVAFPAVVQRTLNTDDNSTLQNGGECLRAYISVAPDQVRVVVTGGGMSFLTFQFGAEECRRKKPWTANCCYCA